MGKKWDTFSPAVAAMKQGLRQLDKSPRWREGDRRLINPNLKGRTVDGAISSSQIDYDRSLGGQRAFQDWTKQWACEVFRVLKPGAHVLVCGAPRSGHRMIAGVEDAGFEIRDCLAWIFGQGFPKSLNLGDGRGTALKPAYEPIVLARKPLIGTVAQNVLEHGTGALNIDACRLAPMAPDDPSRRGLGYGYTKEGDTTNTMYGPPVRTPYNDQIGRWPANVCLDEEAARLLDEMSGERVSGGGARNGDEGIGIRGNVFTRRTECSIPASVGGASRFFYVAKPSRAERDHGIYDRVRNGHPTVKPVELMRWLVRLITPPNGTVLDPFCGSGTTGMACAYEFREFIGIEREAEYVEIAKRRIAASAPLFQESARDA
jgi:DNA modification methylase